jgi:Protein of unknown function (DUF3723)
MHQSPWIETDRTVKEQTCYLETMLNQMKHIFEDLGQVDHRSISLLQGRSPFYSLEDAAAIRESCYRGELFVNFSQHLKAKALSQVMQYDRVMISMYSYREDTMWLECGAKVLVRLLPPTFKGTIRQGFAKYFCCPLQGLGPEHVGEEDHKINEDKAVAFSDAYRRIWLFALRNYPYMIENLQPRLTSRTLKIIDKKNKAECWYLLARLAKGVGFSTPIIEKLSEGAFNSIVAVDALSHAKPSAFYNIAPAFLEENTSRVANILSSVEARTAVGGGPELTTDVHQKWRLSMRCGRPYDQAFKQIERYAYVKNIYDQRMPMPRLAITHFAVFRDTFHAFFGRNPNVLQPLEDVEDNQSKPSSPIDRMDIFDFPGVTQAPDMNNDSNLARKREEGFKKKEEELRKKEEQLRRREEEYNQQQLELQRRKDEYDRQSKQAAEAQQAVEAQQEALRVQQQQTSEAQLKAQRAQKAADEQARQAADARQAAEAQAQRAAEAQAQRAAEAQAQRAAEAQAQEAQRAAEAQAQRVVEAQRAADAKRSADARHARLVAEKLEEQRKREGTRRRKRSEKEEKEEQERRRLSDEVDKPKQRLVDPTPEDVGIVAGGPDEPYLMIKIQGATIESLLRNLSRNRDETAKCMLCANPEGLAKPPLIYFFATNEVGKTYHNSIRQDLSTHQYTFFDVAVLKESESLISPKVIDLWEVSLLVAKPEKGRIRQSDKGHYGVSLWPTWSAQQGFSLPLGGENVLKRPIRQIKTPAEPQTQTVQNSWEMDEAEALIE